jgi:hypothetical protein
VSELGANIADLRQAADRFAGVASRLESASGNLMRASWNIPPRFGYLATHLSTPASRIQQESHRLSDQVWLLRRQADDQERTSQGRGVGSGAIQRSAVVRAGGIGRAIGAAAGAGAIAVAPRSFFRLADSASQHILGQERFKKAIGIGNDSTRILQAVSRSRWVSPHAPRTISGLLKMPLRNVPKRFALKAASASTKAKYLKQAKGGIIPLIGSAVAILGGSSSNRFVQTASKGLENLVAVTGAFDTARKLSTVSKMTRPALAMAKVGGGLAVVGGVFGLAENWSEWRTGKRTVGRAAIGSGVSALAIGAGVAMFIPGAAPIAAGVLLGVAAAEAALWVWDNNPAVKAAAGKAVSAVGSAAKAGYQAASNTVAAVSKTVDSVKKGAVKSVRRLLSW